MSAEERLETRGKVYSVPLSFVAARAEVTQRFPSPHVTPTRAAANKTNSVPVILVHMETWRLIQIVLPAANIWLDQKIPLRSEMSHIL